MICFDLLIDSKKEQYCHNCKYFQLCDTSRDMCDFGADKIAKELGMPFNIVIQHVRLGSHIVDKLDKEK